MKPNFAPAGYLAFLGRIAPEKGPETAIRIARAAGVPLKIAAKVDKVDEAYFETKVRPLIDGKKVEFVGEIDEWQKAEFLGNAAALLFPICWPEPFGLVIAEAMACGTPLIAFRCGSVPELIEDGVSGFVVDSQDEALIAIDRLATIDRRVVRGTFERRFTARRMAEDYVHIYETLIQSSATEGSNLRAYSEKPGCILHGNFRAGRSGVEASRFRTASGKLNPARARPTDGDHRASTTPSAQPYYADRDISLSSQARLSNTSPDGDQPGFVSPEI